MSDVVSQVNFSVCLTHANDGLDVTDRNRNATYDVRLTSDVCVELSHLLLVNFIEFGMNVSLGVNDVLLQHFLVNLEVRVSLFDLTLV